MKAESAVGGRDPGEDTFAPHHPSCSLVQGPLAVLSPVHSQSGDMGTKERGTSEVSLKGVAVLGLWGH
jgi:hypothetical protein